VLNQWLADEDAMHWGDGVAVDGKSLRGSAHGHRDRPVHLLAALTQQTGQVMAQVDVDVKTNEIPKVKDLFDPWDISGKVVTWDARHTQTETARYLVADKRAHYVMDIKGNQPSLRDAVKTLDSEDFSPCKHDLGPGTRSGGDTDHPDLDCLK
jgi:hypothetical protein